MTSPYLIIDFSSTYLFALILDEHGNRFPCAFNFNGVNTRYFFSEVFIQSAIYENEPITVLNQILQKDLTNVFFSGDDLGWTSPSEKDGDGVCIKPLYRFLAQNSEQSSARETLPTNYVFSGLLVFVLQPIIKALLRHKLRVDKIKTFVIVPEYLNRSAVTVLRLLLKKRIGFKQVHLLHHTAALAMHCIHYQGAQSVGLVREDNNYLHVSKVKINHNESGSVQLGCSQRLSTKSLGWEGMIARIAALLRRKGLTPKQVNHGNELIDRAFNGLVTGCFDNVAPFKPPLRLTYQLLTDLLNDAVNNGEMDEFRDRLKPTADILADTAEYVLTAGPYFMFGGLEKLILDALNKTQSHQTLSMLALERAAYGVANMIRLFHQGRVKSVTIRDNNAIQVAGKQDCAIELIRPHALPRDPGQTQTIRQDLALDAEDGAAGELMSVDILWGNNPVSSCNSPIGSIGFTITEEDLRLNKNIRLNFFLKKTKCGLSGHVTADMDGSKRKTEKLHFTNLGDLVIQAL